MGIDGEEQNERKNKLKDDDNVQYLPQEVVIEHILTKLPAPILAVCCCVSKVWCNLISNDTRFAVSHFIQNKDRFNLVFSLLNVFANNWGRIVFFGVQIGGIDDDDELLDSKIFSTISYRKTMELVGYCNGLACVKIISEDGHVDGVVTVINPNRSETLSLPFKTPNGGSCRHLCDGFGFDSLSQEYKAVVIYNSLGYTELFCMVITLGTNSWRTIVTRIADMSPPPGCSSLPYRMITKVSRSSHRQATLCGGHLFWRITNRVIADEADDNHIGLINDYDNKEMLLTFNIHDEKIQFIRFPAECTLSLVNEHQNIEVDHHLLESKGYPCVARSEKIMVSNRFRPLRRHQCSDKRTVCHCRYMVHLYILKDKVKQVWEKGEIFDIQMKEEGLPAAPFCCYFGTTTATNSTTTNTVPTRILSFSDQMLLYWFDGDSLIFYNLQTKHLKFVKCTSSCNKQNRFIFELRMQGISAERSTGEDDNPYCLYMDYQLHAQVENILSLKTFIPEGETSNFEGFKDYSQCIKDKLPAGVVSTGRTIGTLKYYPFYS